MIEIKNIVFVSGGLNFIKCFLCFINHLLPLRLKFANESYIALVDNKKSALVTLDKDSKSHTRFKITKLILEQFSASVAPQLINYVISKYRAQGATSFYVVVDEKQADLLNIFKNEMNFRASGFEYLYKINSLNHAQTTFLKPFKKENISEICKFYNENINSYNKPMFSRENYQFNNNCQKYVFYNDDETKLLGYFEVATKNNHDFYINFSINFAYNIYIIDAIRFVYSKLKHKHKSFNLYIKVKDYFINSKELLAILNENHFEFISKSQILAKDYYRQVKENNILKNAKIIFNDPTIA
ncbi:hypothetical protein IJX73_00370 [bacterium]|nr:hypothetical protein [bacterium]